MDQRPAFPLLLALLLAGCTAVTPPMPRRASPAPRVEPATVLAAVRQAASIRTLPPDLTPSVATAAGDVGFDNDKCEAGPSAVRIEPCVFGDRASARKVVLYGDSHAGMWLPALIPIAERRHWRLQMFGKPGCPALMTTEHGRCDRFRAYVLDRIRAERPDLVVVTNQSFGQRDAITAGKWLAGLREVLTSLRPAASRVTVLGDVPVLDESGPECLSAHPRDVSACVTTRAAATERLFTDTEEAAAKEAGADYVPVLQWLCGAVCTPVIGNVTVYRNRFQLTATYARMLTGVVEDALMAGAQ